MNSASSLAQSYWRHFDEQGWKRTTIPKGSLTEGCIWLELLPDAGIIFYSDEGTENGDAP
jgi:hypothetical protein